MRRIASTLERYSGAKAIEEIVTVAVRDFKAGTKERVKDTLERRRPASIPPGRFEQLQAALGKEAAPTRKHFRKYRLLGPEMVMDR